MLLLLQNSAEEMLQLVEHYCDYFRMALPVPTYMNFISSYGNNIFAREQLQKQKTVWITSKITSFSQVSPLFLWFPFVPILGRMCAKMFGYHDLFTNGYLDNNYCLLSVSQHHDCIFPPWKCNIHSGVRYLFNGFLELISL